MKLFMIELCAIIVIIVVSAFALKLYKRFYKYFSNSSVGNLNSKPENSSAPESEAEIKDEPPTKPKRVAPDIIVLNKTLDPDEVESDDSVSETVDIADDAESEDSSAAKEHKTKIYSFNNGESSDSESHSEFHDPSSPETESKTKIFTGSDSESSPPSN